MKNTFCYNNIFEKILLQNFNNFTFYMQVHFISFIMQVWCTMVYWFSVFSVLSRKQIIKLNNFI